MKKRKQQSQRGPTDDVSAGQAPEATGGPVRLRLGDDVLELTPTAEYPILVLQTDQYEAWINGVVDLKTNARTTAALPAWAAAIRAMTPPSPTVFTFAWMTVLHRHEEPTRRLSASVYPVIMMRRLTAGSGAMGGVNPAAPRSPFSP